MFVLLAFLACLGSSTGPVLWNDPGRVELVDFTSGAGGTKMAPAPPFSFVREASGGTSPKAIVRDANNIHWRLKGGIEGRVEAFITRLVAALGYYAEPTYFLAKGQVHNLKPVGRASSFLKQDGSFTYASLERIDPTARFSPDKHWTWSKSPFAGSSQLKGLKILVMLLSNWDNKDHRDLHKGSNTSVLSCGSQDVYFVNDWGQALGMWGRGGIFGRHTLYDCESFSRQTAAFVKGVKDGYVQFGYEGQHTADFKNGVTVDDVRWLMQYLGRVTDAQIRTGLMVSGASKSEEECFARALRERIEQLRRIAADQHTQARPTTRP